MATELIDTLSRQHDRGDAVRFEMSPLGGPVIRLAMGGATAMVALQGAQVLAWSPTACEPVIWLSPSERLGTAKAVRGGIPVCWPWFAGHPEDASKPAHGFVRTRLWDVVSTERLAGEVSIVLATATTSGDAALWPHAAEVSVRVALSTDRLSVALRTRNRDTRAFQLTQALHTYFAVGDIAQVRVEGFDGLTYIDKLDANVIKPWHGPIRFAGEVDRIYVDHTGEARIIDEAAGRVIVIAKEGSQSSVVWNPWIEKCARLGDMGPEGYRGMVCVETTNAGRDVVTLAPGASHTLAAIMKVAPV
jgi:glucose-6-phosphate 1-epimerase